MFIYKITNKVNGMVYIGRTKCVYRRWREHCRCARIGKTDCKLYEAIREYSPENFTVTTIDHAVTKDEANEKEIFWIKHYNAVEEGYNTSPGGRNGAAHKKVMCVETGRIYNSRVEACKDIGVSNSALHFVVDNPKWTCRGYHWVSVEN